MIENFLRYFTNDAEFHRICDGLPDKRHRAFLRFAYAQLISRSSEYTPTPDGKFDLAFFAKSRASDVRARAYLEDDHGWGLEKCRTRSGRPRSVGMKIQDLGSSIFSTTAIEVPVESPVH